MGFFSVAQVMCNFGEFFGAIAVVATLGYLTVQIRQNTKALRVSAYADFVDRHLQMVKFQANHAAVISQPDDYDTLSVEDRTIHVAHLSGMLRNGDALHYQWQQGLLDDARFESALVAVAGAILNNQSSQRIWDGAKSRYNPDYRSHIDALLIQGVDDI
jgi:hypothetical protein